MTESSVKKRADRPSGDFGVGVTTFFRVLLGYFRTVLSFVGNIVSSAASIVFAVIIAGAIVLSATSLEQPLKFLSVGRLAVAQVMVKDLPTDREDSDSGKASDDRPILVVSGIGIAGGADALPVRVRIFVGGIEAGTNDPESRNLLTRPKDCTFQAEPGAVQKGLPYVSFVCRIPIFSYLTGKRRSLLGLPVRVVMVAQKGLTNSGSQPAISASGTYWFEESLFSRLLRRVGLLF